MSRMFLPDRPARIVIRKVSIQSVSRIDARRLADGLGPALERALEREAASSPPHPRRLGPSDRAAAAVAAAIFNRLRESAP